MNLKARLLGLAFAAADALAEVDTDGRIAFAMGSNPLGGAATGWSGKPAGDLFHDGEAVMERLTATAPGQRSDQMEALVACADGRVRRCSVRAFRLPELAPALSLALSYLGPAVSPAVQDTPPLLDAAGLMAEAGERFVAARRHPDQRVALSFVTVAPIEGDAETQARAEQVIASTLHAASVGGAGAARLTPERYALLRLADDARDVVAELHEAGQVEGLDLTATESTAPVPPSADPLCALRAMRFAIEGCLKDGGLSHPEVTFSDSLKRTLKEADTFRAMVKAREFALHYQPIVDLGARAVHHFEALARFPGVPAGPAGVIRMAEELALIDAFDLAVVEKAVMRMKKPGSGLLKLAVNVSAGSLASDDYASAVLRMTAANPADRRRLTVEITESAALADVEAADRRIAALRGAGITVCIDDFGVGAASFAYLQRLSVDAVKIDGGFVRDLDSAPRARSMIRGLVELCGSLGLKTIAEMVETEETAAALKTLGVDYGQGWLFGRPEVEPRTTLVSANARRRGEVEAWG